MERASALYAKSLEETAAQIEADSAKARAAEVEERVKTVRETEEAERKKTIDVLLAEKAAEEARLAADAEKVRSAVEAEAQRLVNEAENVLTEPARASLFKRNLLNRIEGIVAASVKPMEKISDIRIVQMEGAGNGGFANGDGTYRTATDEVINSALRYRVQAPLVDSLLNDMGIEGANLAKMGGLIREASDMQRIAKESGKGGSGGGSGGSKSGSGDGGGSGGSGGGPSGSGGASGSGGGQGA